MTMVWTADRAAVDPAAVGRRGVRLVETFRDAAVGLDGGTGEPLVVIGPDVRLVDVAAFVGYVRGMRYPTAVVLVRRPADTAAAAAAGMPGIAEVVPAGLPDVLDAACRRAVAGLRSTPDRAPAGPTVFGSRPVDPASVTPLDAARPPAGPRAAEGPGATRTVTTEAAELLATCVRDRLNVVITGAPGAGKTTLLTSMAALAPARDRLVTLDDGTAGAVCEAMSGARGSLATLVAHSPQEALALLESALPGDAGSRCTARARLTAIVDALVHIALLPDGIRRITHVTEVRGVEAGGIATEDRYRFDAAPVQLTG